MVAMEMGGCVLKGWQKTGSCPIDTIVGSSLHTGGVAVACGVTTDALGRSITARARLSVELVFDDCQVDAAAAQQNA